MIKELDNPHPIDDFENSQLDTFKNDVIDECQNFEFSGSLDGWDLIIFHTSGFKYV